MAAPKDQELLARFVRKVLEEHAAGRLATHKAVDQIVSVAMDNPDAEGVAAYMRTILSRVWKLDDA